jgi:hypothetical protein
VALRLAADLSQIAVTTAIQSLNEDNKRHLASRVSERHMRDAILGRLPRRADIVVNANPNIQIEVASPYPAELTRISASVAAIDLNAIVARYPIRECGIPRAIAIALRFIDVADYQRAVLARLAVDQELRGALTAKFGALAALLA